MQLQIQIEFMLGKEPLLITGVIRRRELAQLAPNQHPPSGETAPKDPEKTFQKIYFVTDKWKEQGFWCAKDSMP